MFQQRSSLKDRLALTLAATLVILTVASSALAAADPANTCAAAKQKAAAQKFSNKVKCHGVAIKKAVAVDPACLAKAEAKFETAFAKAEAKGGCSTTADAAAIELMIDTALGDLLTALPGATVPPASCDALNDCQSCSLCTQEPGGACESAVADCSTDAACTDLNDCLGTCPDDTCRNQCLVDFAAGLPLYNAAIACIEGECSVSCGAP